MTTPVMTRRRTRLSAFQSSHQKLILAAIVAVYLGLASLYAGSVPKWNAPDEPSHFNYVKTIVSSGTFPILRPGDYDFDYLEKAKAARFPDSLPIDSIRYESHQPPLYYSLAAPLLALSWNLTVDSQVLVLRLFTALFGALTIVVTFSIARRIFPDDVTLPLAAAAFVAFVPMHVFMNAATTNDSLANLLLSALLLALVVSMTRRSRPRHVELSRLDREAILWGVLLGLGLLTKATTYIGVVLIALTIVWQEFTNPRQSAARAGSNQASRSRDARTISLSVAASVLWRMFQAYGVALLLSGWWFVRNATVYGNLDFLGMKQHDLVVVGQPLTGPLTVSAATHFVSTSFKSFWGVFGWMGVFMDERIYVSLAALSAVAILGIFLSIKRFLSKNSGLSSQQQAALALVAVAFILLSLGILQYNLTYVQAQGRYFFPAITAIAIFFTLGLRELVDRRHTATVFTLLFLGFVILDYLSLNRLIIPQLR